MNKDGIDTKILEDNYSKLIEKLRSVYDCAKLKSDMDNLDTTKELILLKTLHLVQKMPREFIKLFCKAFDQQVTDDDVKEDDQLQLMIVFESDMKEKPEMEDRQEIQVSQDTSENVGTNESTSTTETSLTPRARMRLEHGSFSNSKLLNVSPQKGKNGSRINSSKAIEDKFANNNSNNSNNDANPIDSRVSDKELTEIVTDQLCVLTQEPNMYRCLCTYIKSLMCLFLFFFFFF
ncbi:hypothetical protein RFI_17482 [Reticulomyxa filosa]|uniref:Uncharacterized protein n=1 Tax=Reticulomyxa filosa TaxID=46433 RepID=X6N1F6_RETFI|nr:hypothetical protein RFI_17482 [Reticulomyxa filosa]|eukprot:ETO19748.1 hypothetical protein RFI_17482 [Reticulomyxa filosa]